MFSVRGKTNGIVVTSIIQPWYSKNLNLISLFLTNFNFRTYQSVLYQRPLAQSFQLNQPPKRGASQRWLLLAYILKFFLVVKLIKNEPWSWVLYGSSCKGLAPYWFSLAAAMPVFDGLNIMGLQSHSTLFYDEAMWRTCLYCSCKMLYRSSKQVTTIRTLIETIFLFIQGVLFGFGTVPEEFCRHIWTHRTQFQHKYDFFTKPYQRIK